MKQLLHGVRMLALAGIVGSAHAAAGAETHVDGEPGLAADMPDSRYAAPGRMQRQGYAAAFRSPALRRVIARRQRGRIAVIPMGRGRRARHAPDWCRGRAGCGTGRPGAVVLPVRDLDAFSEAMLKKRLQEISGTPRKTLRRTGLADDGGTPC